MSDFCNDKVLANVLLGVPSKIACDSPGVRGLEIGGLAVFVWKNCEDL